MKYTVVQNTDESDACWDVPQLQIGHITEAEASIIAFALNSVAHCGTIRGMPEGKLWMEYNGPTEGVAP